MSTVHSMQSSMQFGPEWMRAKPAKPQGPSPPPATTTGHTAGASSHLTLASSAPTERDEGAHPLRYSREEMLKIYRDGGGKGGLGLEVERHEGGVRESVSDPVGLGDTGDNEKRLFGGSMSSEMRRKQSLDPLLTSSPAGERPRLTHSSSMSGTGSPLRERFGGLMRRRESSDQLSATTPRKLSLSGMQAPGSPRDGALPSPRTRIGHTPTFDGVLSSSESWMARRRASEAKPLPPRDPDSHETRGIEIKEEDEDTSHDADGGTQLKTSALKAPQAIATNPSPPATSKVDDVSTYSPVTQNGTDMPSNPVHNGPPPGIIDPASIDWSYLDPQGQLQGPFQATIMQKWYDEGYFTSDLLMKRTHHESEWTPVGQLAEIARLNGIDRLFLAPLRPAAALNIQTEQPAPLQPAPLRTLRSSTLDSFVGGGSNPTDSPASSFGGRFHDDSPDRGVQQYAPDHNRFGDPQTLRRNTFGEPIHDPIPVSRFGGGLGDIYSNRSFSPAQGPWQVPTANNNLFGHGQGFAELPSASNGFHDYLGGPSYVSGQQFSHLNGAPQAGNGIYGQSPNLKSMLPAAHNVPSQSPWGAVNEGYPVRRPDPIPAAPNGQIHSPIVQASPWSAPLAAAPSVSTTNNDISPWFGVAQGVIEDSSWKEELVHDLTVSNLGHHNQQYADSPIETAKAPDPIPVAPEPAVAVPQVEPVPVQPAVQPAKARTKSIIQPPIAGIPAQPAIQRVEVVDVSAAVAAAAAASPVPTTKPAWAKEEDAKRPSGITLSLRDIQDAEAKKAEARKVPDRAARPAVTPATEEAFTATWGLPTSQAGSRSKDAPAPAAVATAVPASAPAGAATASAVWTNATKAPAKKTMKEIQEEEEKRKKMAAKENAAAAARRAYAESTSKAPPPVAAGGAWTTVGAKAPTTPVVVATRPAAVVVPVAAASAPRANGIPASRPAPVPVKAAAPREDYPANPSVEFLKWLGDSLKGLNNSVNIEDTMTMLLTFPLDPDPSTVEIISDLIYSSSTTLDGRRFASEFVSRRKADAVARPKGVIGAGSASKAVSIADVVKAQPKPSASSEWGGFKVVNKKKKGGRS